MNRDPRVLLVSEHASAKFGGEAFLPLHYFRVFRGRGVDAHLVSHERTKSELLDLFPHDRDRLHFVPDLALQKGLFRVRSRMPTRLGEVTCGLASHLLTQRMERALVRRLVREKSIDIVHEPSPVSPRQPSAMYDVGAPVVIGPMNGGMVYPPAFRARQNAIERRTIAALRLLTDVGNRLVPGKPSASALLVANERTRAVLSPCMRSVPTYVVPENGVDLSRFHGVEKAKKPAGFRFAYAGRLIDWKGVDLLLEAFPPVAAAGARLEIFGDGPARRSIEEVIARLDLADAVDIHGFLPQDEVARRLAACDALVLPSLYECGGAVVLEAMALRLPVVATRWGGPADYLDESCGLLVAPDSRDAFVRGLGEAMMRLVENPLLGVTLGAAARAKVVERFDWERKADEILRIYEAVLRRQDSAARAA